MRAPLLIATAALILAALAGGALVLNLAQSGRVVASQEAASASPEDFDARIHDYILRNPDVIVEALRKYDERQTSSAADEIKTLIEQHSDEIFKDPDSPMGGNPQGDVTIVEFFDYNCPYCRSVAPTLIKLERTDPGLRFVYKEFPILGPGSEFAARAALASARQGKYIAFHRALMQASGPTTESRAMEIAATVGLDIGQLEKDLADPKLAEAVNRNIELARSLRITGTPGFVIKDTLLPGAAEIETFRTTIAHARGGGG